MARSVSRIVTPGSGSGGGRPYVRALAAAVALLVPLVGVGAEPKPDAPAGSAPANPAALAPDEMWRLDLREAVRQAVQNSLDVEILRFDPEIAEADLLAAWGSYDPQIFGEGGHGHTEIPTASELFSVAFNETRLTDAEAGLRGLIPWVGGAYSVSYAGAETESNSNLATLSPQFTADFLATLQVPLLRGLFWSPEWTLVRTSRIGVGVAADQFASRLMDVVRQTEDAYWGLVANRDATRVARKSLETAQALLEQTKAQYDVGVVSKVEVVQSEAGVADREFRLITAQAAERTQQDVLIDLVLGPYLAPRSEIPVELIDKPGSIEVREVDPEVAAEKAFSLRPELSQLQKQIEQQELQLRLASNQRLPQLDIQASYGNTGLSGNLSPDCVSFVVDPVTGVRQPCRSSVPTEFGDANNDFFTDDAAKNWTVRGVVSVPIGNFGARGRFDRTKFELRRTQTQLHRLQQSIVTDVRRAARILAASVEGIEAAERAVAAAEEQLRAERVRLEYGESTPFDVLLREDDLVTAEGQLITAHQAYQNAITALERAQGTILTRNGIVIEQAAALR